MAKNKQKEYRKEYSKQRSRLVKAKSRAEKQGYFFDESVIPPKLKDIKGNIKKSDIEKLRKITPEKLREKATTAGFVDVETGEFVTKKEYEKQKQNQIKAQSRINIAKAQAENKAKQEKQEFGVDYTTDQKQSFIGEQLFKAYRKLIDEGKIQESQDFISKLKSEDYQSFLKASNDYARREAMKEAFKWASQELNRQKEAENGSQENVSSGGKAGENLLPDEGNKQQRKQEYQEESGTPVEQRAKDEEIGTDEVSKSDERRKVKDNTISKNQQNKIDKAYEQWKEDFERQKHMPRKEREYSKDSYSLLAGIKARISMFDRYMQEPKFEARYWRNAEARSVIERALNGAIRQDGLKTVLKRIQNYSDEIGELIDDALFQYRDAGLANHNALRVAHIFHGRPLTTGEIQEYSDFSSTAEFATDDDMEEMEIDEDE